MSVPRAPEPFFVGYISRVPRPLAAFLGLIAAAFVGSMAGLALAIGASVNDPGDGRFAFDEGQQELTGTLTARPYPVLHIGPADSRRVRSVLLVGQGKRGVIGEAAALDGQAVDASGVMLRRGTIAMLQVGGRIGLRAAENTGIAPPAPAPVSLGRWRLTGEICDGKCYAGAMRPGRGLAHKACANLCLIGGTPPVFVSAGAVEGETFFLMADASGGPLADGVHDLVALTIEIEGEVERRGSVMVFKADLSRARRP